MSISHNDPTPVDGIARLPSATGVAQAIRAGICPSNRTFDQFLPYDLQLVSGQHWTPVAVALRAAEWLDGTEATSVVDVGSGAGKFCVAAALASRCSFVGIEHRLHLVEAARNLARVFGVDDRVQFIHGTLELSTIPAADAYYLYNPFGENLFGPDDHIDEEVELSSERYRRDIALMERFFEQAPVGTRVIKYNGFGGRMPGSYDAVMVDREMPNLLQMWRKSSGG